MKKRRLVKRPKRIDMLRNSPAYRQAIGESCEAGYSVFATGEASDAARAIHKQIGELLPRRPAPLTSS